MVLHISFSNLHIFFRVPQHLLQGSSTSPSVFPYIISFSVPLHFLQCSPRFPSVFPSISFSVPHHLLNQLSSLSVLTISFSKPTHLLTTSSVSLQIFFCDPQICCNEPLHLFVCLKEFDDNCFLLHDVKYRLDGSA